MFANIAHCLRANKTSSAASQKENHDSFDRKSKQFHSCSQECDKVGKQGCESVNCRQCARQNMLYRWQKDNRLSKAVNMAKLRETHGENKEPLSPLPSSVSTTLIRSIWIKAAHAGSSSTNPSTHIGSTSGVTSYRIFITNFPAQICHNAWKHYYEFTETSGLQHLEFNYCTACFELKTVAVWMERIFSAQEHFIAWPSSLIWWVIKHFCQYKAWWMLIFEPSINKWPWNQCKLTSKCHGKSLCHSCYCMHFR